MTVNASTSRTDVIGGPALRPSPARPTWSPRSHELDDLEMLLLGGYGPLRGFLGQADIASVARNGRLTDATPCPVAITLTVDCETAGFAAAAGVLELLDEEGTPVASMTVEETWPSEGGVGLAGVLVARRPIERGCHRALRRPAPDVASSSPRRPVILGVPLRRPLEPAELVALGASADAVNAHIRLLPLTGCGSPEGLDPVALVCSCLVARDELVAQRRSVDVVPVAVPRHRGFADDRERMLAAMVAQAYGATHVVGPLPTTEGLPVVVDLPGAAANGAPGPCAPISGRWGEQSPRRRAVGDPPRRGLVVLFTGLSGSGKSTVASAVRDAIVDRTERPVTLLDGDVVRRMLSAELTFSRPHREMNVRRIGFVAAEVARHGGIVLCAPIAPHAAVRAEVRQMVEQAQAEFILVHVATPIEVCEGRDRKGLYAKARRGEIPHFTGISDPYEQPLDADLTVDTSRQSLDEAVQLVLGVIADAAGG